MVKTRVFVWIAAGFALLSPAYGKGRGETGKPVATIAVRGNLIVMTLDEDVLVKESLFELFHHTLRFTPEESQFRVENAAWQWNPEFGYEMSGSQATMKSLAFPFSGRTTNSFSVGVSGSITFGKPAGGRGGRGGGISVDRFAELAQAARSSQRFPATVASKFGIDGPMLANGHDSSISLDVSPVRVNVPVEAHLR
jgi:hypothetical protein